MNFILKDNRDRNRPMTKMPRAQLEEALAASDRIRAISDEIRRDITVADGRRWGETGKHWCGWLEPVDSGATITGARARLEGMGKPKTKKAAAPKAPAPAMTFHERLTELERARAAVDRQVVELAEEAKISGAFTLADVAAAAGLTRQTLYRRVTA